MGVKMHMKAKMFASLKDGGHLQVFELVDHPEITITRRQETRKHNWVQTISVDMTEFDDIEKEVVAEAEKLITKAKHGIAEGGNRVHAQRQLVAALNDKTLAKKVFDEFAPRYAARNGGYTRMIKIGKRQGDAADMVVLELVDRPAA